MLVPSIAITHFFHPLSLSLSVFPISPSTMHFAINNLHSVVHISYSRKSAYICPNLPWQKLAQYDDLKFKIQPKYTVHGYSLCLWVHVGHFETKINAQLSWFLFPKSEVYQILCQNREERKNWSEIACYLTFDFSTWCMFMNQLSQEILQPFKTTHAPRQNKTWTLTV